MTLFFRFSLGYFCLALLVVLTSRDNGLEPLYAALKKGVLIAPALAIYVAIGFLITFGISLLTKGQRIGQTITPVAMAAVGTVFFQVAFTLIKTSMPYIIPFYADPFWADFDLALHGGTAPWFLTHSLAEYLPVQQMLPLYLEYWTIPAVYLPTLIAVLDSDGARIRRIMTLYLLTWVLIGNVLALSGMSAGPVYYDRLLGGESFAGLSRALVDSGIDGTNIGLIQEKLWRIYTENGQAFGSGISAFPSVHVGVGVVGAIYLYERSKYLAPFGLAFVCVLLYLSVYTGYHYAIDGYVSILLIFAAWRWLVRRDRQTSS